MKLWILSSSWEYYSQGTLASSLNSPLTAISCGHKSLIVTWHWRPSSCRECREKLSLTVHFQDLWCPLMLILTVLSCKGCSQHWRSQIICALLSLLGLSPLKETHLSLCTAPKVMCWRCFRMRGPCPIAPRPSMAAVSRVCEGLLGFFTHFLSQPCSPGLLEPTRLKAAGPGVTAPLRTHCSIQAVLPLLPTPQACPNCVLSLHLPRPHPS